MQQLTNEQRKRFAITPVSPSWELRELQTSRYDGTLRAYAYVQGNRVKKLIQNDNDLYGEFDMNELLSEDGTILLPKTAKGKPQKLTYATLNKRPAVGMGISYCEKYMNIVNYSTEQDYYVSQYDDFHPGSLDEFWAWIDERCADVTAQETADIEEFSRRSKVHVKYKEGDFFRFRINCRLWGYGRIIVDYGAMRKQKIPFWDIFMGKPLLVGVYHIMTEDKNVPIEELEGLNMLPPQMIMDNIIYYGTCEIIGNRPLSPEDFDCPIHYGRSKQLGEDCVIYQCGRDYRVIPHGELLINGKVGDTLEHEAIEPYALKEKLSALLKSDFSKSGIGFLLNANRRILSECIAEKSNEPYWRDTGYYKENDLRNPKFAAERELAERQFGIR